MTIEPGTTLGRYQILAPLGHGGMATVYKASSGPSTWRPREGDVFGWTRATAARIRAQ